MFANFRSGEMKERETKYNKRRERWKRGERAEWNDHSARSTWSAEDRQTRGWIPLTSGPVYVEIGSEVRDVGCSAGCHYVRTTTVILPFKSFLAMSSMTELS